MPQIDTAGRNLPVATGPGTRFSNFRGGPKAAFLSQLIAERHHLYAQRARRQAPMAEVLRTYDEAGRIAVRRVPPGYRMDIEA